MSQRPEAANKVCPTKLGRKKATVPMRRSFPLSLGTLVLALTAYHVAGATAGNPYEGIVERNVFSLKPPPPPGPAPTATSPAVKMTLTGITTILGKKQALLCAQVPPLGPTQPAKQESYILAEGQRDGDIEVVSIDENAGVVKITNRGSPETLDFVNNGAKIVNTGPGPAGAPGMVAPQGGIPGQQPGGPGPGGMKSIPPRIPRTAPAEQPQPNLGMGGGQNSSANQFTHERQLTPDEQTIMMEVERERTRAQVEAGTAPPLPPTSITPEGAPGYIPPDAPTLPQ